MRKKSEVQAEWASNSEGREGHTRRSLAGGEGGEQRTRIVRAPALHRRTRSARVLREAKACSKGACGLRPKEWRETRHAVKQRSPQQKEVRLAGLAFTRRRRQHASKGRHVAPRGEVCRGGAQRAAAGGVPEVAGGTVVQVLRLLAGPSCSIQAKHGETCRPGHYRDRRVQDAAAGGAAPLDAHLMAA